jgi:polyisoprenoid-binding protein YceI
MERRFALRLVGGFAAVAALSFTLPALRASADPPLAVSAARVTIAGSSNVHEWTASTTTVRLTAARVAATGSDLWRAALTPGGLEQFEIAIPAETLTSHDGGLDKNMYKALRVKEFADITYRVARIELGAPGAARAIGTLRIAGVEKEVALDIQTEQQGPTLKVTGQIALVMTDYGIKPPTAMLGMLKTDPKVTITFETVLAAQLS